MKRSFTLIELIFVIVIIGLLASVAVPKFMQTKTSASANSAKSVVSSIRTTIETKHGEWIINDNLGASDGYTPQGYPTKLDEASANSSGEDLFVGTSKLKILKNPIKSCLSSDCWFKYKADDTDNNLSYYAYKFTDDANITLEYNGSDGKFECIDDGGMSKSECQSVID
jgi:prepilin-type N-terminal cleavage/methylation domain-containing protein